MDSSITMTQGPDTEVQGTGGTRRIINDGRGGGRGGRGSRAKDYIVNLGEKDELVVIPYIQEDELAMKMLSTTRT